MNVDTATSDADAALRLSSQLCFPLYAAARLMVQAYKPHLDPLGLTYPQYLTMLVLWEEDSLSVRTIADRLALDSATLTQILKNLESAGLVTRTRVKGDARTVVNQLTRKGQRLKLKAASLPHDLVCKHGAEVAELSEIKPALERLVGSFRGEEASGANVANID